MKTMKLVKHLGTLGCLTGLMSASWITGCSGDSGNMGPAQGGMSARGGGVSNGGTTAGSDAGRSSSGGIPSVSSGGTQGGQASGGSPDQGAGGAPTAGQSGASGAAGTGTGGVNAQAGQSGAGGAAGTAGGVNAGGSGGFSVGGAVGSATPSLTKDGEVLLTNAGLSIVSFGGYLNGESFQQEGIVTFQGYQYTAFWNTRRHVVLARRSLPSGAWQALELNDYTNSEDDAHNTISLGISPGDGTLHLAFDHHVSELHYRSSVEGLLTNPAAAMWAASSFRATTSRLVGNSAVTSFTYPRFVTQPDGKKLLFEGRIGDSGSGDQYLWEYDSVTHAWTSLGMYVNGTADSINAYPHGLSYAKGGARLHMSWCWRESSNAATNHDLFYVYSDDHGRTWKNNQGASVATTGSAFVGKNSVGVKVWTINQNRGLINTEHMAVDATGRVHVLLAHMPDTQADDATFESARTKSQYFHYWRDLNGTWTRTALGAPSVLNFRGKLAISSSNNLYAILPDLRIAAASAASNFSSWSVLDRTDAGRFFSDPLIDSSRLLSEDKLSIFYPQKSSANIYVLDYTIK